MNSILPYEFYRDKLGVKIKFLISDKNKDENSLCLIGYRALKKRMDSDTSSEKPLRRSSLGHDALVEFGSLCREWQDALVLRFGNPPEKIRESYFSRHYFLDSKAFAFFKSYRYGEEIEKSLDPETIEIYTHNASILNTCITIKNNRRGMKKALGSKTMDIWESIWRDVKNFTEVAHSLPTHKDSLRRKILQYEKEGYRCLISGKLQNKNAGKVLLDEQTALLDELLAKHQNLDNEIVCTLYNAVAQKIGWKTITSGTVANRRKDRELVVFAGRNGVNALRNELLIQNKRKKSSAPLLYWTLDGWDVELLYQKTEKNAKGKPITTYTNRVSVVVVLDPFNDYPVGYAIGTHETPTLIRTALLNAMHHVHGLFGHYYKPYQLQSDRYGGKELRSAYMGISTHYTPARVKNAKSKSIESWFSRFNKKYCRMANNWSGYNVDSGSHNQPNDEYLNTIRHTFPDYRGVCRQIEGMLHKERKALLPSYMEGFKGTPVEDLETMDLGYLLDVLGLQTSRTCRLEGQGITPVILGEERYYDSFDLNFRKLLHTDWKIKYTPFDLKQILVVSSDEKHRFLLNEKYTQPMALYDRQEGDAKELQRVFDYNDQVEDYIIEERAKNSRILSGLFAQHSALEDTMAKHLLVDSVHQHKNQKSAARLKVTRAVEAVTEKNEKRGKQWAEMSWQAELDAYHKEKIDLEKYLK